MQETQKHDDTDESNSKYIVLTENIEIGTLLLGTYTCESPEAAVRGVLAGDYQSPPSDPAYDIAVEDASNFTVYELNGEPTAVTRETAQSHGNWKITESGDTLSIHYKGTIVLDLERETVGDLFTAIATVYPKPDRVAGDEDLSERAPVYNSFVNPDVGPVRIYAGSPQENALMWIEFTSTFKIPTRTDAHELLDLLRSLYPQQTTDR